MPKNIIIWPKQLRPDYGLTIFTLALVFFLFHPFGNVFQIVGDNICQIAYWHVLFNHELTGSIGAAAAKPGLILLLGFFYDLSNWLLGSPVLIKILLAFFASLLVYATARLTADVAGSRIAGILSALYLISMTSLTDLFRSGSSMIFFLPLLLIGLRFFAHNRKKLGVLILCGSTLIRPEGLGVLIWLAVSDQLLKRRFRESVFILICVLMTVFLFFITSYLLQGDLSRLNSGGPATGYVFEQKPTFVLRLNRALQYVIEATGAIVFERPALAYLSLPALVTLLAFRHRRTYLSILGIVLFWIAYFSFGAGDFVNRYFEFLIPLIVSFGWGGVFYIPKKLWTRKSIKFIAVSLIIYAMFYMVNSGIDTLREWQNSGYAIYTQDAIRLLASSPVPRGSRLMTEDDIAYGIVARSPNYFRSLNALQFFNIKNDADRRKILEATDYILISKTPYRFYYLWYDPLNQVRIDSFRRTIKQIMADGKTKTIYGRTLTMIENSMLWLVLRVDP